MSSPTRETRALPGMCDRARDFLGSAGCQPAVDGSLPATFRRIHGTVENQSRQAAETYRLAAYAPQNPEESSLRALFERVRLATQECERFAGEME